MRRWLALAAGVLALAAVLVAATALASRGEEEGDSLGTVERRDVVRTVEVSGTLQAVESVSVGPPAIPDFWDFRIAFMAPEGARVRPGQPILAFDTSDLERRLVERTAARDSAQKEIEKRRADLVGERRDLDLRLAEARAELRRKELELEVPDELVAADELAQTRIDRDLAAREIAYLEERLELMGQRAEAEIATLAERRHQAARRVEEIESSIRSLRVGAPRSGIVLYTTDGLGEKNQVGDIVWHGEKILEIPDLGSMEASGEVDEVDAGSLEVGQPVILRLDAHPDIEYRGTIERIGRTVRRRSAVDRTKVVSVQIGLESTDQERMRPGMRFRGRIEVERRHDVVAVPEAAVRVGADGPRVRRVSTLGGTRVVPDLGLRGDGWIEVLDGLAPGDRVALVRGDDPSGAAGGEP